MAITLSEIKQVLKGVAWNDTSEQEIFSKYLPRAKKVLVKKGVDLSKCDESRVNELLLKFFKPYCLNVKAKKCNLETKFQTWKDKQTTISPSDRRDAAIREQTLIRNCGGQEFYNKILFG